VRNQLKLNYTAGKNTRITA